MNVREKMRDYRKRFGISLASMSKEIGVSEALIAMVETGDVTHPLIAKKFQNGYWLTDLETEELMPEIHRKSSPKYDPTKYVEPESTVGYTVSPQQKYTEWEKYAHANTRKAQ